MNWFLLETVPKSGVRARWKEKKLMSANLLALFVILVCASNADRNGMAITFRVRLRWERGLVLNMDMYFGAPLAKLKLSSPRVVITWLVIDASLNTAIFVVATTKSMVWIASVIASLDNSKNGVKVQPANVYFMYYYYHWYFSLFL